MVKESQQQQRSQNGTTEDVGSTRRNKHRRHRVTIVPGIFYPFHVGHHALIRRAFRISKRVVVCIRTDSWIRACVPGRHPGSSIKETARAKSVRRWLRDLAVSPQRYKVHLSNSDDAADILDMTDEDSSVFLCGAGGLQWRVLTHNRTNPFTILSLPRVPDISSTSVANCTHPFLTCTTIVFPPGAEASYPRTFKMLTNDAESLGLIVLSCDDKKEETSRTLHLRPGCSLLDGQGEETPNSDSLRDVVYCWILMMHRQCSLLPISTILRPRPSSSKYAIAEKQKSLIEGGQATIFAATPRSECCIAKVGLHDDWSEFVLECRLAVRAGQLGYGPVVRDWWMDKSNMSSVLIIERWESDLDECASITIDEVTDIFKLIAAMHADGVFHHDLYSRNVLWRHLPTNDNSSNPKRTFCITDFGLAFPMRDNKRAIPPILRAADYASLIFGTYDDDSMSFSGGLHTSATMNELVNKAMELGRFTSDDWFAAIRIRVVNSVTPEGLMVPPCTKDAALPDVTSMYKLVVANLPNDTTTSTSHHRCPSSTNAHTQLFTPDFWMQRMVYADILPVDILTSMNKQSPR